MIMSAQTTPAAPSDAATTGARLSGRLSATGSLLLRNGMVGFLVVLVVAIAIVDPTFVSSGNLLNLGLQWAPVGIMAIGMTFVVIGGGFDLSVGGTYAMSAVLYTTFSNGAVFSPSVALLACIGLGIVIGLLNGALITRLGVNPFVATLGTGYVIRGLALVFTAGTPIALATQRGFDAIGNERLGGLPIPVWLLLGLFVIGAVVLSRTAYGTRVLAVGGSEEASRLSGLRTRSIRTSTYVLSGACAAIGGVIIAARLSTGEASVGTGIELQVITVVLAGGIALSGGEGRMWRAAVGLLILATIGNAFDLLQVSTFWQSVVTGVILVVAVALDHLARSRARQPRPAGAEEQVAAPSGPDAPAVSVSSTES